MEKSDVLCLLANTKRMSVYMQGTGKPIPVSKAITAVDQHNHKGKWRMSRMGKRLVIRTA